MEIVICDACKYQGDIRTFNQASDAKNDVSCPKCGSTCNQHNIDYQAKMMNVLGGNMQFEEEVVEDDE